MAVLKVCVLVSFLLVCAASCCHMDTYDHPNFPQLQTENYTPDPAWQAMQDSIKKGREIFENTCTSCHAVGRNMIGPDIAEALKTKKPEWIKSYILHPEKFSKDPHVRQMRKEFQTIMPEMPFNDPHDIDCLMLYLTKEYGNAVAEAN